MVELTLQVSDSLATKIQSFGAWSAAILELSLLNCRTKAVLQSKEIVAFLEENPSQQEVLKFKASAKLQNRLRKLLAKNREAEISEIEVTELEELKKIEHIFVMLKIRIAKDLKESGSSVN
ncbi:MAG: hypothetical protein H7Z37_18615 [Pyrinomonadaceae bacterium]|nr:hypothetical protein [Pyrinomonadaceae bacterium]